jgi:ATP-dependent DNA helicase RecG
MKRLHLKEPVFLEPENSVIVQIKHEKLASAEDIIMEYLDNPDNNFITNRVARGLTGIESENSMKVVFLRLRERELIEPVPGREAGSTAAWQKKRHNGKRK